MYRNFLPNYVGIAMLKSEFCFATGLTPYNLKKILKSDPQKWERLGLKKYDKLIMPQAIRELLRVTGLQIDLDYYAQYVHGKRSQVR